MHWAPILALVTGMFSGALSCIATLRSLMALRSSALRLWQRGPFDLAFGFMAIGNLNAELAHPRAAIGAPEPLSDAHRTRRSSPPTAGKSGWW